MLEPPTAPDTPDDLDVAADRESAVGTPRWVKVFALIALVLVVLLVVLLLIGGHGPGRHTGFGGQAPLYSATEHGVR